MLMQLRPKVHTAYQSLPILGPIVDEFSDWAHHCGYELRSFKSQLGNIRYLAHFFHRRGLRSLRELDRKSTRLNSSHLVISYAVFCLKKKKQFIEDWPFCA